MINRAFRLFVSSTFSDFRRERVVLQTRVFPRLRTYCRKHGYRFQPIDLRWGINQEAQLDQLPANVKIVISDLEDENYPAATRGYQLR
jgi:hypothetical protein